MVIVHIDGSFSFERYFSFRDEELFFADYRDLRRLVPSYFDRMGLPGRLVSQVSRFIQAFDAIGSVRQQYNDDFVKAEAEKFSDFFNALEGYPLSADNHFIFQFVN